jgi:hypothetical protein
VNSSLFNKGKCRRSAVRHEVHFARKSITSSLSLRCTTCFAKSFRDITVLTCTQPEGARDIVAVATGETDKRKDAINMYKKKGRDMYSGSVVNFLPQST